VRGMFAVTYTALLLWAFPDAGAREGHYGSESAVNKRCRILRQPSSVSPIFPVPNSLCGTLLNTDVHDLHVVPVPLRITSTSNRCFALPRSRERRYDRHRALITLMR